uniref:Putative secreted protein n=1 Tax=Anopheles aquasalis TaxID=42839 RepID=T1E8H2_ANOAQ
MKIATVLSNKAVLNMLASLALVCGLLLVHMHKGSFWVIGFAFYKSKKHASCSVLYNATIQPRVPAVCLTLIKHNFVHPCVHDFRTTPFVVHHIRAKHNRSTRCDDERPLPPIKLIKIRRNQHLCVPNTTEFKLGVFVIFSYWLRITKWPSVLPCVPNFRSSPCKFYGCL